MPNAKCPDVAIYTEIWVSVQHWVVDNGSRLASSYMYVVLTKPKHLHHLCSVFHSLHTF